MLGFDAFGTAPFAVLPEPSIRLHGSAQVFPLYQPGSALLTGGARFRTNSDNRLFAATEDYTSWPEDRIASRLFAGTVRQALRFTRSILGGPAFDSYTVGLGEMILTNASGEYDHLIGSHAIDGRRVVVRLGGEGDPHASFGTVFDGQSTGWHVTDAELVIALRDFGYQLEVPASPNTYAGTGGIEGGEDLKGKRKPRAFGHVLNVTPAALSLGQSLIHQVNDGPVFDIPAVYVRGVPLARGLDHPSPDHLASAEIEAGAYQTCLAAGLFRLRFLLGDDEGHVTADVAADAPGLSHTAAIVARIATGTAAIERLNAASFDAVEFHQPARIGTYLETGSETSVANLLAALMAGVGGWVGFRRNGELEIGILRAPVGRARARFTEIEIIEIDREPLPEALETPPWRVRVAYARNWTVQDQNLAGSVGEARRSFLREEDRSAEASDERVKINHPLAQDPALAPAWFAFEADAQAEATRRLRLYRSTRSLYRLSLKTQPFALDLGEEVHVTYPRWDLKAGRTLRIVALDEDTENNIVELVVYG